MNIILKSKYEFLMTKSGNESLLLTKIKEESFFDLSNKN
jgi:hypothetical protein